MTTPTKAKLAEKLAAAIYEHVAPATARARERALAPFRGLRISPRVTVNPETGAYHFSFGVDHEPTDLEATLERLLELPAELAAEGDRRVALIFDEFQEVETIDPGLPRLMRTVFEQQPEVVARLPRQSPAHDGAAVQRSQRAVLAQREEGRARARSSARAVRELHPQALSGDRARTRRPEVIAELLERTGATRTRPRSSVTSSGSRRRSTAPPGSPTSTRPWRAVLRSENAHFQVRWESASAAQKLVLSALAREPGRPLTGAYRSRHDLPGPSTVQTALDVLRDGELITRESRGSYRIVEPFLDQWILALDEPDELGMGRSLRPATGSAASA